MLHCMREVGDIIYKAYPHQTLGWGRGFKRMLLFSKNKLNHMINTRGIANPLRPCKLLIDKVLQRAVTKV